MCKGDLVQHPGWQNQVSCQPVSGQACGVRIQDTGGKTEAMITDNRNRFCLAMLLLALATALSAAERRSIIAPGVEKIIHANGTVEYRQVAIPEPAGETAAATAMAVPAAAPGNLPEAPPAASAETTSQPVTQAVVPAPQLKIYKFRDKNGVVTYQSRAPGGGLAYTEFKPRPDCFACATGSGVNWETTPLFAGRYEQEILHHANLHGISPALVKAVIHAESAFNPQARSRVGAQGLMQLMPATAAELGVASPFDPAQNIDGGVRYLAMLMKMYNQDVRLATAAYNAGPGAVRRYNGVPAYPETRAYVQRVAILERRYRQGN